ncbi:hypothetical protein SteCoe_26535 [Stentor coeruleus]|uniref:Uncharacterized protein n=1 Tax=Stentor coeruleus TaxID=5963 RepID=A0A1R2BCM9_9CILI|nr:hypothetical protein SteCoe_26535 [Stentor coeruleus]
MLVFLIQILACSSYTIEICSLMAPLTIPCNQNCLKTYTHNNASISYGDFCLKNYTTLSACLIRTGELLEENFKKFSPCFSKEYLKKVKDFSAVLVKQTECLNHFSLRYLTEDEDFYDSFEYSNKISLKFISFHECKTKTMTFAKELSEYAIIYNDDEIIKKIVSLLIEEINEIKEIKENKDEDEIDEELLKAYEEELEINRKLQKDMKNREFELKIKKKKEENDELRRKIEEIEKETHVDYAPARVKPIRTEVIKNSSWLGIGIFSALAYALIMIFVV